MNVSTEILIALFLLLCLMLSASSRMLHCIRIVALQGLLLGLLPFAGQETIHFSQYAACAVNIVVKALVLPYLLWRAGAFSYR